MRTSRKLFREAPQHPMFSPSVRISLVCCGGVKYTLKSVALVPRLEPATAMEVAVESRSERLGVMWGGGLISVWITPTFNGSAVGFPEWPLLLCVTTAYMTVFTARWYVLDTSTTIKLSVLYTIEYVREGVNTMERSCDAEFIP
jgi:hypothetical protein